MKKIITACFLGLFLVGGLVGCSSSSTTAPVATTKETKETKKEVSGKAPEVTKEETTKTGKKD